MWQENLVDGVVLTRDLVAAGWSSQRITRWVRGGELEPLVHGAYAPAAAQRSPREHHRLRAVALTRLSPGSAASHTSAAILHQLPLWHADLSIVHLTSPGTRNRLSAGLHRHRAVPGCVLGHVGTTPTVGVADAVVGLGLAGAPAEDLLMAADHALRVGLTAREGLDLALARHASLSRIGHVRALLLHADPRHESPMESCLHLTVRSLGHRATPQVTHHTEAGVFRVDLQLDDEPVVLEVDGRVKYADPSALFLEKRREDALRDAGQEVVRVVSDHVLDRAWVGTRIRAAIKRAHRRAA